MKKVKYVGPLAGVVVVDRDSGASHEAAPGDVIEVGAELAAGLLEQDVWEAAGGKASTKSEE